MTCTSTCLAPVSSGSQNTVPSPKAACASRRAAWRAAGSSSALLTTRMPRPPPPADALTSTGYPVTAPGASSGSTGTPASAASFLEMILEPMASIASAGGPIQVRPAACTARANPASSDRNPYPGCTASAPAASAAATIAGPFR